MAQYTNYILVCGGTGCRASQSEQIIENLRAAVEQYGLEETGGYTSDPYRMLRFLREGSGG